MSRRIPSVDAPKQPTKGMELWVQWGSHVALGERYTISRVTGRSFYVQHDGRRQRLPLEDWRPWLLGLMEEGTVYLDGRPMRRPGPVPLAAGVPSEAPAQDPDALAHERSLRIRRALHEVLPQYEIKRRPEDADGRVRISVQGGDAPYEVTVDPEWAAPPRCDCPDAAELATGGTVVYCKHVVAVLLAAPDLRCQLLAVLL